MFNSRFFVTLHHSTNKSDMIRQFLQAVFLLLACKTMAGEIVVNPDGNIHEALRQAREWRRTNDARCQGGITITVKAGRYYMTEPLFIRPEDSGTDQSPLIIRGEAGTVICGDPPQ